MSGIGVLVNPRARENRRRPDLAERLRSIVGESGLVRETQNIPEIADVAGEFLARQVAIVAVCGGDGSVFRCLSALVPVYRDVQLPRLLPLRAGTINFVAEAIGCRRGSPEKVLAHVTRDYLRGGTHDVVERDLLCVNGEQYGFVFGCGAVVNFLRAYYGQRGAGPLRASLLLAKVVASALAGTSFARAIVQPVEADILCDGERVPFRVFTAVLGATVDRIALGFRPTYLATRKRGYFHIVAGPIGAWAFLRSMGRLQRGFPTGEATLYDNLAREVTIRFTPAAAYMMDGDILPAVSELRVTTGPRLAMIRG